MKNFANLLVAFVVVASLSGCGENPVAPGSFGDSATPNGQLSDVVNSTSGKVLFESIQSHAIQTLSLSEIVQLTPYISGVKSIETATLAEISAITPVVVKFQAAFNAEMAALSVGEVNRVLQYMDTMGMDRFPYPALEDASAPASFADSASPTGQLSDVVNSTSGKVLFESVQSHAIQTLSLSEIVQLTPYLSGTKSIETATLAEISAITPIVVKFQAAFNAEMAAMSVGEVNRVLQYMDTMGMDRFPYPALEDASVNA